jgi:hypothetical protein
MKKIIFILLLIPILSSSQETNISVTLQARDCEFIGSFTGSDDLYQDLDSLLKNKFRPGSTAPSGTTNVVITGITNTVWFRVCYFLRRKSTALNGNNNPFTRTDAALRAASNTWLTNALDADAVDWDLDGYTNDRAIGRKRLKKE